MIAMRMVALLIAMQTTRASDMGTMIAMRNAALLIAAATQTLGLAAMQTARASDTCNLTRGGARAARGGAGARADVGAVWIALPHLLG